jgi:hypothetical protein
MRQLGESLTPYAAAHPKAKIELKRYSDVSVRVRILDPDFRGKSRVEREEDVWPLWKSLPEDVVADISMLLLLTPEEKKESAASFSFDHPTPSPI